MPAFFFLLYTHLGVLQALEPAEVLGAVFMLTNQTITYVTVFVQWKERQQGAAKIRSTCILARLPTTHSR